MGPAVSTVPRCSIRALPASRRSWSDRGCLDRSRRHVRRDGILLRGARAAAYADSRLRGLLSAARPLRPHVLAKRPTSPCWQQISSGYRNLIALVSKGFLEGYYYKPRIDLELLAKHNDGLIALSGCMSGLVAAPLLRGRLRDGAPQRQNVRRDLRRSLLHRGHAPRHAGARTPSTKDSCASRAS